jgi:hypothetical protein
VHGDASRASRLLSLSRSVVRLSSMRCALPWAADISRDHLTARLLAMSPPAVGAMGVSSIDSITLQYETQYNGMMVM